MACKTSSGAQAENFIASHPLCADFVNIPDTALIF